MAKYGSDAFRLGILRGRSAGMTQAFNENSVIAGRNLCNKLWNISRLVQSIVDENNEVSGVADNVFLEDVSRFSSSETYIPDGAEKAARRADFPGHPAYDVEDEKVYPRKDMSDRTPAYTTLNMGEDWICREISNCISQVENSIKNYRFAEAIDVLYQTIWDKYADWFLESQKIYKNTGLLKKTLETILIALHPFAPFLTEAIWQNLSWTDGFIATAKWPEELKYDPISAAEFEILIAIVSEVRGTCAALPGANNAKKYNLLYGNDSLVEDNLLLIRTLTKVPAINSLEGRPRGLRLALANHELYLDVSEKVVTEYKDALTEKILSVGRELDALNARMMNPSYVEKAPEHLVKETTDQIKEKEQLISRLKTQLEIIQ